MRLGARVPLQGATPKCRWAPLQQRCRCRVLLPCQMSTTACAFEGFRAWALITITLTKNGLAAVPTKFLLLGVYTGVIFFDVFRLCGSESLKIAEDCVGPVASCFALCLQAGMWHKQRRPGGAGKMKTKGM